MTCHTLEEFYRIDGHTFERQYKDTLSGFREWEQLDHADEWVLLPENIGPRLAIDESALSNGELYTFVTNRDVHTRERSLVAVVAETKSKDVIAVLERIGEDERNKEEEVTLDLSDSMRKIVSWCFPKAKRVIDRFHIQKLACDAVQESASNIAGMPYNKPMMRWRTPNSMANGTHRSGILTVTPGRNCSYVHVIFCSSPRTNGLTVKSNALQSSLMSIPISKRHTACAIHSG